MKRITTLFLLTLFVGITLQAQSILRKVSIDTIIEGEKTEEVEDCSVWINLEDGIGSLSFNLKGKKMELLLEKKVNGGYKAGHPLVVAAGKWPLHVSITAENWKIGTKIVIMLMQTLNDDGSMMVFTGTIKE